MSRKIYSLLLLMFVMIAVHAQSQYAAHSLLSQGKWVKIRVADNGVYQLTKSDLKKMGFNDPAKVKLYGYNRPILPDRDINDIEDDLTEIPLFRKGNDILLFYSKGTTLWKKSRGKFVHENNPYSSYIYYFLTQDTDGEPAKFECIDAKSDAKLTQKTFLSHSLFEKDEFSFANYGRRFYEAREYNANTAGAYKISLPKHVDSEVFVDILFGAKSNSNSTIKVTLGNEERGPFYVYALGANQNARMAKVSYSAQKCNTDVINVVLHMLSGNEGHLDYIRASYERPLDITGEKFIEFTPNENGTSVFEISGADENISIWNVSSPADTYELKGNVSQGICKVLSEDMDINDLYVAVNTKNSFPTPEMVGKINNQDLHSYKDIEYLVIIPANGKLRAEAERLVAFHAQHDGTRGIVVSTDMIYNEFSSGTPDVTAYRRFIKMLYDKGNADNGRKLRNVLLFGASIWDNKFITPGLKKYSQDDYILCYESENSESMINSYILEEYISCPEDNNYYSSILGNLPEIGLGRLPVTTPEKAKIVVDKTIEYISNKYAGNWRNAICILADDGKKGNGSENTYSHMKYANAMANSLEKDFDNFKVNRIYWDAYQLVQTAKGATFPDAINDIYTKNIEGALIMNYTGHGSPLCLSHEQVLKLDNFKSWKTNHLPVWITAACETAPIDMNTENLGEESVLNKEGGAIAFIGTTRSVIGSDNDRFNTRVMKYLLTKKNNVRYSIGEAVSLTKKDIILSSRDTINKSQFVLIGDPAIILPNPTYDIVIDSINGKDVNEGKELCRISAGEHITIIGHITNENGIIADDYNGIISPTIYDNKETIKSNNNYKYEDYDFYFEDYKRKLYAGSDSIKNGVFKFTFPVPMDNNYSDKEGLINLYAINEAQDQEAFGSFKKFTIGGTSKELATDTIGPSIATFINSNNTIDGQKVNDTPTIYVNLSDSSGINSSGNGLGHDIVAIIDGKEATTYNLNSYFRQTIGDYTSGKIEFTFPSLEAGSHTLTVRAFDTYNNMSEQHYSFEVYEGLTKVIEYYDFAGRLVSNSANMVLPKGVYIKKTRYMSNGEEITSSSEKVANSQ